MGLRDAHQAGADEEKGIRRLALFAE